MRRVNSRISGNDYCALITDEIRRYSQSYFERMWDMKRTFYAVALTLAVLLVGQVSAAPGWYRVSFTGTDMFNYTTGIDELYNQDAPRRYRMWDAAGNVVPPVLWTDTGVGGVSDFQAWATANLANYKFSYFNLVGGTIPADYWDQPYHAVPSTGAPDYGVNSWSNVLAPAGWTTGVVQANHGYQSGSYDNYAFPVWRAPVGGELTLANAANMMFSFDVLMENPESAFEPDGTLRVWFGGFDQPQDFDGATNELGGIMVLTATPIPAPSALLLVGLGTGLVTWLRKRSAI
jgi:hypothetical protein